MGAVIIFCRKQWLPITFLMRIANVLVLPPYSGRFELSFILRLKNKKCTVTFNNQKNLNVVL